MTVRRERTSSEYLIGEKARNTAYAMMIEIQIRVPWLMLPPLGRDEQRDGNRRQAHRSDETGEVAHPVDAGTGGLIGDDVEVAGRMIVRIDHRVAHLAAQTAADALFEGGVLWGTQVGLSCTHLNRVGGLRVSHGRLPWWGERGPVGADGPRPRC